MIDLLYYLIKLFVFGLTFVIEFVVYVIGTKSKVSKAALYALLINGFTWPLATRFSTLESIFLVEFIVFVVEFVLIMLMFKMKWWKALLISLIANTITMILGFILLVFGF
ncbi:MAG: hypothetical protein KKF48_00020 [Nanoarchaeota archaeon]|nr:hypothetical protein [Nanoarchaeota archaeon]MBU1027409.1 hypothetical protein [Nanoarchaeota archaeon]